MKFKKYVIEVLSIICSLNLLCIGGCSHEINRECESISTTIINNEENANLSENIKNEVISNETPALIIENEMISNETPTLNIENEEEFKSLCEELVFKEIDKKTIGKYVTKELIFGYGKVLEDGYTLYECGATEDFLEDLEVYQKTYNVYRIKDYRIRKDFPIEGSDVMRIYGIVEDVSRSYKTGNYNPTIKIYYAEYVRKYGEKPEDAKSEEEIKKQREEVAKELEYKDSLNSDYTGTTKNRDNMDELPLTEYMIYCDAMNLQDVVNSNEDFTGRYVKLHIQVSEHKKFNSEDSKINRLGEWTDISNVQDDVWYCKLYNERVDEYVYPKSKIDTLYFFNRESINAATLSKGDNLIVYGQFVKHNSENGEFEMLVRYYEKE